MSYSWDPTLESYEQYLRNRSYLGEITSGARRAAEEICAGIDDQTRSLIGSNEVIARALSRDIDALEQSVAAGFEALAGSFNWGFSQVRRGTGMPARWKGSQGVAVAL